MDVTDIAQAQQNIPPSIFICK
uniref:Uncharacterized protein n=1 Tax=Arundo donax TaxID=35708 RepID=A0A0A8YXG1_ARUDO